MTEIEKMRESNAKLRDVLAIAEILTATGDGLPPTETIDLHLLLAEGRNNDPAAWRIDGDTLGRLRECLKRELTGNVTDKSGPMYQTHQGVSDD